MPLLQSGQVTTHPGIDATLGRRDQRRVDGVEMDVMSSAAPVGQAGPRAVTAPVLRLALIGRSREESACQAARPGPRSITAEPEHGQSLPPGGGNRVNREHWPRRPFPVRFLYPSQHALGALALVATKPVLAAVPPLTLALLRFVVALAVLLPLAPRGGGRPELGRGAAGLGVVGMSLFFVFQNVGLRSASATSAALILNGGIPVLTVLLATLLLRERVPGRHRVGTLIALAGVGALVLVDQAGELTFSAGGDALLLAAAACGAGYTILGRRRFAGGNALAMTTGSMLYGALFLLPAASLEYLLGSAPRPSATDAALIVYFGGRLLGPSVPPVGLRPGPA